MQITINQDEIVEAIENYIGNQGIGMAGKRLDVSMVAGRGGNGFSANIEILPEEYLSEDTPQPDADPVKTTDVESDDDGSEKTEVPTGDSDSLFEG